MWNPKQFRRWVEASETPVDSPKEYKAWLTTCLSVSRLSVYLPAQGKRACVFGRGLF